MSTLKNILKKKQAGEIKSLTEQVYWSEYLQEEIVLKKRTASLFFDIMVKHDVTDAGELVNSPMPLLNELIFTHAEMFEDKKTLKEAMDFHGISEPLLLPEMVFDSNVSEMSDIIELISDFYDTGEMGEDIKN